MSDQHELVELILYAEPGGELGARCAELWAATSVAGVSTTAQEFPPHVTLTGFFHRRVERVDGILSALTDALDTTVPAGLDGVRWAGPVAIELHATDEWVGMRVEAAWMDAVIEAFAGHADARPGDLGDDPIRPKSWLHLSLAYGEGFASVGDLGEFTSGFVGLTSESAWAVSLWQHNDREWTRLDAVDIVAASRSTSG